LEIVSICVRLDFRVTHRKTKIRGWVAFQACARPCRLRSWLWRLRSASRGLFNRYNKDPLDRLFKILGGCTAVHFSETPKQSRRMSASSCSQTPVCLNIKTLLTGWTFAAAILRVSHCMRYRHRITHDDEILDIFARVAKKLERAGALGNGEIAAVRINEQSILSGVNQRRAAVTLPSRADFAALASLARSLSIFRYCVRNSSLTCRRCFFLQPPLVQ
jgi:hypothetical protein